MKCEKCHKIGHAGRMYWFHYGNKISEAKSFDPSRLAKIKQVSYYIAGQESGWVCDRCANLIFAVLLGSYIAVSIAFIALISITALIPQNQPPLNYLIGGLICFGLPWLIIGGVLVMQKERMRTGSAEALLIREKKKNLERQGFRNFFTTETFQRLEWQR